MEVNRKIKMVAADRGMPLKDLASKIGLEQHVFATKMSRGIVKISDLEQIFDALDCDIVIVDRKTGKIY